jgi:hypothetical protein
MKYTPNHASTAVWLNTSPDLRRVLELKARTGMSAAVAALSPRRRTGRLQASATIRYDGPNQGVHHDRMAVSIEFTVPYAVPASFPGRDEYLRVAIAAIETGN